MNPEVESIMNPEVETAAVEVEEGPGRFAAKYTALMEFVTFRLADCTEFAIRSQVLVDSEVLLPDR